MTTDTVDTPLPEPFAGKPPRNRSYKRLFLPVRDLHHDLLGGAAAGRGLGHQLQLRAARRGSRARRLSDPGGKPPAHHSALFAGTPGPRCKLVAGSHTLEQLSTGDRLFQALGMMNADVHSFFDLGVIDNQGRHLRYVGPLRPDGQALRPDLLVQGGHADRRLHHGHVHGDSAGSPISSSP